MSTFTSKLISATEWRNRDQTDIAIISIIMRRTGDAKHFIFDKQIFVVMRLSNRMEIKMRGFYSAIGPGVVTVCSVWSARKDDFSNRKTGKQKSYNKLLTTHSSSFIHYG